MSRTDKIIKRLRESLKLSQDRLNGFLSAADYDSERDIPAGKEARFVWACIIDKPHWALPTIQYIIDERDQAKKELQRLKEKVNEIKD